MQRKSILPATWHVPQEFRDRLGEEAGRQRVMVAEGHLLIILHRAPQPEDRDRHGRFFWRSPDGSWSSSELGGGIEALNQHLAEYHQRLERLEEAENGAISASDYFQVLEAVAPLHRSAEHMDQVLQEARQQCREDQRLILVRDRAYRIERIAELLYTSTKNGLDFAMAERAEEHAVSAHRMATLSHRLNLLVAFFFPVATLTSVFGMSLHHGLEDQFSPPLPFLGVLAAGLLMGMLLTLLVTRRLAPPKRRRKR